MLSFQSISSFYVIYYLFRGVDGSFGRIPVCYISSFNRRQRASNHIWWPTVVMNWDYLGNRRVCLRHMQSSHFRPHRGCSNHLSETSGVCCHANQTLSPLRRKQHKEGFRSEISECDSLSLTQESSLRSRPVACEHTQTLSLLFTTIFNHMSIWPLDLHPCIIVLLFLIPNIRRANFIHLIIPFDS